MQKLNTTDTIESRLWQARAGRPLYPSNGNDRIFTPPELARDIVAHFRPCGRILEPAAGDCAFVRWMPGCDWCEIDRGVDFFNCAGHYDWLITNPPYSLFTRFLEKSVAVADNIVFLCPENSWGTYKRTEILRTAGFGTVEVCQVPLPPKPWPQFGVVLAATWVRRGWLGSPQKTRLPSRLWAQDGRKMRLAPNTAPTAMDGFTQAFA